MSMTLMQGTVSAESRNCCDSADLKAGTGSWPGSLRSPMTQYWHPAPTCPMYSSHHPSPPAVSITRQGAAEKAKHSWCTVFSDREGLSIRGCFPHRRMSSSRPSLHPPSPTSCFPPKCSGGEERSWDSAVPGPSPKDKAEVKRELMSFVPPTRQVTAGYIGELQSHQRV